MEGNTTVERIRCCGVLAVLVIDRLESVRPLAETLLKAGIGGIELTLRTPVALDAVRAIKKDFPSILCGVGTVISPDQVRAVVDAGGDFAVAPGTNRRVIETARSLGIPFAPGISTASDIETGIEYGLDLLKFFPAEAMGGVPYLRSISGPYAHLGLQFIPLGGVSAKNASSYLGLQSVAAIGGSWIAGRELIREERWDAILENGLEAMRLVRGAGRGE